MGRYRGNTPAAILGKAALSFDTLAGILLHLTTSTIGMRYLAQNQTSCIRDLKENESTSSLPSSLLLPEATWCPIIITRAARARKTTKKGCDLLTISREKSGKAKGRQGQLRHQQYHALAGEPAMSDRAGTLTSTLPFLSCPCVLLKHIVYRPPSPFGVERSCASMVRGIVSRRLFLESGIVTLSPSTLKPL